MNKKTFFGVIFAVLSVIFTVVVKKVNVAAIGPAGTSVGLARINGAVFDKLGTSMTWYKLTWALGMLALLIAALFIVRGVVQFIMRKSLRKMDCEMLGLAGLYVVMFALYVIFEKVVINYRPVVMPGETAPEASFPSSHTMLTIVILGSTILLLNRYMKKAGLRRLLQIVCALVIIVTVVGRLLSGVHWFTDIIGGVLISITLLALYAGAVESMKSKRAAARRAAARTGR